MLNRDAKTRAVVVRVTPEQYDAIHELSRADDRSICSWIRVAVDARLAANGHDRELVAVR
jgi:hypothetical protein